jgi:hypothetical protein
VGHWLEDIERHESKKHRSARDSARIQDKIFRIKQNYEKNRDTYDAFINKMNSLVERVNNLPMEYREDFNKIKAQAKESKLENKLHLFSSSRRYQRTEFKGFLNPLKNVRYKHVRIIYFNVAKIMDKVEVEVREEYLEKKRRDGKIMPEEEDQKRSNKPSGIDKDKFHQIYYYEMASLTPELALRIIDWLAYKEELDHLPVIEEGEPRFRD